MDLPDRGQYASLALTHVQYHPADPLSVPLSLITLAPPFLLVSYITLILVRRELTISVGLVGQLACEGLNLALKRIFKQGRPTDFLGTGYGMPSSHSQFMGYFMAFWLMHLYRFRPGAGRAKRARQSGQGASRSLMGVMRTVEHFFVAAFVLSISLLTAYSRYHLSYHTAQQILVGFSTGIFTGLGWYYVFEILAGQPQFGLQNSPRRLLLDHPIFVALRIRDSWAVWDDGGIEGEYGFWRREWESRRDGDVGSSSSDTSVDVARMLQALQLANECDDTTTAFSVGCVITCQETGRILATGYSREQPGNTHAEEVALNKLRAMDKSSLPRRMNLYTTMEPCSQRLSKKDACVQRILAYNNNQNSNESQIVLVLQGVQEPDDFVQCEGTDMLQQAGISVQKVVGPVRLQHEQSGQVQTPAAGWLEREAIRLAKKGHDTQPVERGNESRYWRETGWTIERGNRLASDASAAARKQR